MGGTKTQIVQAAPPPPPPAPAAPTASSSAADFAASYPKIMETYIQNLPALLKAQFEAESQYAPQLTSLQSDVALQQYPKFLAAELEAQKTYGPQLTQAAYDIQKQLYPETTGLQEKLAGVASRGMDEPVPDAVRQSYLDELNSGLGYNVSSPVAADYRSRGLMTLQEDWKRYYQNLALTVSGRQPLQGNVSPTAGTGQYRGPQIGDLTGGYNPGQVMGFNQGIYGSQAGYAANTYGSFAGAHQFFPITQSSRSSQYLGAALGLGGAIGGGMMGGMPGASMGYGMGAGLGGMF